MTQQVALIVHHLMDEPERFIEKENSITNGYYEVKLDGSSYGMGAAFYPADGAARNMLMKAIESWKSDTGWVPKEESASSGNILTGARVAIVPDAYIRGAYEEFARSIKKAHTSFHVHGDNSVFSSLVQQAISKLDSILRPMERIEGRKPDAQESGLPGA